HAMRQIEAVGTVAPVQPDHRHLRLARCPGHAVDGPDHGARRAKIDAARIEPAAWSAEVVLHVDDDERGEGGGEHGRTGLGGDARAGKPAALGALELRLELWLAAVVGAPRVDPCLIGAVAFGRSALGGAGSVMCHYVRPQGGMSMVDEAREIARWAGDVGVRI